MAAGESAGVQQVRLLQHEVLDHVPVALVVLTVAVIAQLADALGPGAESGLGAGAPVSPVVELPQKPGQRRVDGKVGWTNLREQISVLGPLQHTGQVFLTPALHLR